ncbi:MAG: UMP kinase [Candidatus Aenigmarchaeota archaeon]|nr:UMP kinase [Candidatus Aenigmarchaeota archaeon]
MEIIIISLGGSLIIPDDIDIDFLRKFRNLILKQEKRFVIITGGGKVCRKYQEATKKLIDANTEDLDWIGVASTKLNAELLRVIFENKAHDKIIKNPTLPIKSDKPIIIASGWKPGFSSDMDAVLIAKSIDVKTIINMTNINYVCNKDPNKFKDAKPVKKIDWKGFRKLVGDEWNPGSNLPFDPIASKEAEKLKLKVIILNGNNLKNLEKFLNGNEFIGTTIR